MVKKASQKLPNKTKRLQWGSLVSLVQKILAAVGKYLLMVAFFVATLLAVVIWFTSSPDVQILKNTWGCVEAKTRQRYASFGLDRVTIVEPMDLGALPEAPVATWLGGKPLQVHKPATWSPGVANLSLFLYMSDLQWVSMPQQICKATLVLQDFRPPLWQASRLSHFLFADGTRGQVRSYFLANRAVLRSWRRDLLTAIDHASGTRLLIVGLHQSAQSRLGLVSALHELNTLFQKEIQSAKGNVLVYVRWSAPEGGEAIASVLTNWFQKRTKQLKMLEYSSSFQYLVLQKTGAEPEYASRGAKLSGPFFTIEISSRLGRRYSK